MNLNHVHSNMWTKLAITSYFTSIGLGLYGQSRTKFSNDFTYNVKLFDGESIFRNIISVC